MVAKVEWHQGELYPRVGFIVTNLTRPNKRVVKFYNGRGTAEQHIKEGKNAIRWTRLSCHAFRHNAVRLQLHALAYNLANFMRTLALPEEVEQWSLTTLREKLVKIGARIGDHLEVGDRMSGHAKRKSGSWKVAQGLHRMNLEEPCGGGKHRRASATAVLPGVYRQLLAQSR